MGAQLAFFRPLLIGLAAAAAVSCLVVVTGWLLRRRAPGGWAGAVGVAGGYVAGQAAALGWPPFPPLAAAEKLFFLTVAVGVLGALAAPRPRPVVLRATLHGVLLIAAWVLLLLPLVRSAWGWDEAAGWLLGLGAAGFVFWLSLEAMSVPPAGVLSGLTLPVVALGTAVVLHWSGSDKLAQLGLVLAAALGPGVVGGRLLPDRGAATVVAVVLPGLWLIGLFYSEAPWLALVLLAVAPAATLLSRRQPEGRLRPWPAAWVRGTVALACVVLAVVIAHQARSPDSDDFDYSNLPATASPSGSDSSSEAPSFTTPETDSPFRDAPP
jgi:hypothetical protein